MLKKLLLPLVIASPIVTVLACGKTTEKILFESQLNKLDELFNIEGISIKNSLNDSKEYIDENVDDALSVIRYISLFGESNNYEELELLFETPEYESEILIGGTTINEATNSYHIEFVVRLRENEEEEWFVRRNYFIKVTASDTNIELQRFIEEVSGVNRQSNYLSSELQEFVSSNPFAYAQHPTSKLNGVLNHINPIVNLLDETKYYISGARVNTSSYVKDIYLINFNLYSIGETVADNEFITAIQYALISKDI